MGPAELATASLVEVFSERDPEARRAAIARVFAEDVEFSDPEGQVVGREALDAKVQALLDDAPDLVFTQDGPARTSQDLGMLRWSLGPPGGPAVVSGTDVVIVRDGRVATLHTLLELPEEPAQG